MELPPLDWSIKHWRSYLNLHNLSSDLNHGAILGPGNLKHASVRRFLAVHGRRYDRLQLTVASTFPHCVPETHLVVSKEADLQAPHQLPIYSTFLDFLRCKDSIHMSPSKLEFSFFIKWYSSLTNNSVRSVRIMGENESLCQTHCC